MFIGHFAAGMAAKKFIPSTSLAILFLAAQFLDLLWPTMLLIGLEQVAINPDASEVTPLSFTHYPFSHSLVFVVGWSILFAAVNQVLTSDKSSSLWLGVLVLSHWILDLLMHVPDLPLFPGDSPKVGLGICNSVVLTVLVEGAIFVGGIIIYVKTKNMRREKVTSAFWALVVFLVVVYVMNLAGPPPPSVTAIAWAGQLQWLFVLWAWWADRPKGVTVISGDHKSV